MEMNGMESLQENKTSESNLVLLLQLIYAGADVDALLNRGLQYSQIADLIFRAKENNLVTDSETKLELTVLGLEKIKNTKIQQNVKGNWISPLDEFRIEPLLTDEVYFPSWKTRVDIYEFNFKAKLLASSGKPLE
jgi:hypothetical protein